MILTPPAVRARTSRRRSVRRALRAAVTGMALLSAVAVGTPAAHAATPEPSDSAPAGELGIAFAPGSNGVVRAGQALAATVVVENGTPVAEASARATLALGDAPLADRAALDDWLSGDGEGAVRDVAAVDIGAVPAGGDASAILSIAADDPALAARAAGVYPLRAVVDVGGESLRATSVMVVPADGSTPTPVSVVVPITAGPSSDGVLSAASLAELTDDEGSLTAQLDAVAATAAVLAIDPALPASIRVLGDAAPASAVEWLDRLDTLPNARFALQYGDADVAVQLAAGLPEPMAPTSLQAYMAPEDFAPEPEASPGETATSSPSPSPTPTAAPEGPVYPDLAELTSIGDGAVADVFWPAASTADAQAVATLGALGTDVARSLTLLPSTGTGAGAGGSAVGARANAGGAELLVYDTGISDVLSAAASDADPTRRGASLAAATAELAFAAAEADGRPLLVAVERGVDRSRTALRAAITAATLAPGAAPIGLADLIASAPVTVEVIGGDVDDTRLADTRQLIADEGQIAQFATILDDPALLTGPQRAEILQLLGVGWIPDAAAAHDAIAAHRAITVETLDAVRVAPGSVFNLISYTSELLPTVRNDLPYPVTLELVAQPDDPRLVVQDRTEVRAQASSNTRVQVPVESRVGSGAVTVALQLYSPTGVAVGGPESADVQVRAEWETYGLVAIVVLIVLFLGLGVFRTVRARRARAAQRAGLDLEPEVTTAPDDERPT